MFLFTRKSNIFACEIMYIVAICDIKYVFLFCQRDESFNETPQISSIFDTKRLKGPGRVYGLMCDKMFKRCQQLRQHTVSSSLNGSVDLNRFGFGYRTTEMKMCVSLCRSESQFGHRLRRSSVRPTCPAP